MKKLLLGAVALIAFSANGALSVSGYAQDTVRMGTEGAYPPYNFIDDNGEVAGFERELGDMMCEIAKLNCTWVTNDWDSIIPNLVSGNYDTIIAGMSITDERDKVIDFTQEYYPSDPSAYVALAGGSFDLQSEGAVIAAQVNTIQAAYVTESGATLVEFATPEETVAAVKNGEADAVLADGAYLAPIVKESGGDLEVIETAVIGGGVGMGVRESDGDLKGKFDAAISIMKRNGKLNELIAKYFDGKEGGY